MWHDIVGFLAVHLGHTQVPVPGITVFSKQFVEQKVIDALLISLLLQSRDVSLTQMPIDLLLDN